jgi:hypothetical protein
VGFMTRRYRSNHIYSATGTARQVRQSPHPSLVSQSVGVGAATLTLRRFAHVRLKAAQIAPGHQMTLRPRECRDQPAMNTCEWRRPAHQPLSLPLPPHRVAFVCGHPPLENLQPKLGTSYSIRSQHMIISDPPLTLSVRPPRPRMPHQNQTPRSTVCHSSTDSV